MEGLGSDIDWSPLVSIHRLALALAVGMFVGLEREWRGKEAGLRTFGFVSMFGGIAGLLGDGYAVISMAVLGIPIAFLNWQAMRMRQDTELTTSVALLVTGLTGVLCGKGHTITPAAVAVVTAGLLTWKEWLAGLSHKISVEELRSAILLSIFTFAILPVLPDSAIDPWGIVVPKAAWLTVILIAALGFVNYMLWKMFGTRGIELTGFLGGLVNSTVTVAELVDKVRMTSGKIAEIAYEGILLATSAMALRNTVILGILAPTALWVTAVPLVLLLGSSMAMAIIPARHHRQVATPELLPDFTSPFSFYSALKFGLIFLILQGAGNLAQAYLGRFGFYAVSLIGGFISSASATASAASLVSNGKLSIQTAGIGVLLASLASASVNVVLVARFSKSKELTVKVLRATIIVTALAIGGALIQSWFPFR